MPMPMPIWSADIEEVRKAPISQFQEFLSKQGIDTSSYQQLHAWSVQESAEFWSTLWDFTGVIGDKGSAVIQAHEDFKKNRFFPGSRLNYAENLLRFRGQGPAIIYWCEDKIKITYSFDMLYDEVERFAQVLKNMGVQQGDCVAGFLPCIPEAIIGALGAASLGAVWSSCSPDFGIQGVVDRLGQIKPKVLLTTDGYWYKGTYFTMDEKVQGIAEKIPDLKNILVVPSHKGEKARFGDCYQETLRHVVPSTLEFIPVPFDHPLFILYSSGTTGVPKCIIHGHGGTLLQHLKEHQLHSNIRPKDKVLYYTTTGWMMWNWLVSTLGSGATVCLYDGNPTYPKITQLFDMIDSENITHFGTSAKYLDTLRKEDVDVRTNYDLGSLKVLLSTGSPLASECYDYVYQKIKTDLQLSSIAGGTDIISCFLVGSPTLPVYAGELQCAGLGMDVQVFNDQGQRVIGEKGELVCTRPFPSMPIGFGGDEKGEKYQGAYFNTFSHVWCHGDYAEETDRGSFKIYGRSDAVLNPGGVRIGTAEIYRQVEKIPEILESVVVGQTWDHDVRIVLFVVIRDGAVLDDTLKAKIKTTIKNNTTPRHVPGIIVAVPDIPKTVSGKIVELAVTNIIHQRPVKNIDALVNPDSLRFFENLPELKT